MFLFQRLYLVTKREEDGYQYKMHVEVRTCMSHACHVCNKIGRDFCHVIGVWVICDVIIMLSCHMLSCDVHILSCDGICCHGDVM